MSQFTQGRPPHPRRPGWGCSWQRGPVFSGDWSMVLPWDPGTPSRLRGSTGPRTFSVSHAPNSFINVLSSFPPRQCRLSPGSGHRSAADYAICPCNVRHTDETSLSLDGQPRLVSPDTSSRETCLLPDHPGMARFLSVPPVTKMPLHKSSC